MATVRNFSTPAEGWQFYSHFIGNALIFIRTRYWNVNDENEGVEKKRESDIIGAWASLVGYLTVVQHRMEQIDQEIAEKMQKIIDMVLELDITDPETHDKIHDELRKLSGNSKLENYLESR